MAGFIEVLREAEAAKKKVAAATIVSVKGSAYRREGAKMLFSQNGRSHGTLSAGCLESDLSYRAKDLLNNGTSQLLTYDMSSEDDFTWGRGTGCNGVIHVLLESVDFTQRNPAAEFWSNVLVQLDEGSTAVMCRDLSTDGDSGNYLIAKADEAVGSWSADNRDTILHRLQEFASEDRRSYTAGPAGNDIREFENALQAEETEELRFYFFDKIQPKEKLFILGAGPDAEPMVDILGRIGFDITLVDHRPVRLDKTLFPRAEKLIDMRPHHAKGHLAIPEGSYVIIMTHSFQDDKIWMNFLMDKSLRYLGILGPRQRTQRLLPKGFKTSALHSPIGLNVHADGPEEIAVAVAAELIQVRRSVSDLSAQQFDAPFADRNACQYPYLDEAH